MRVLLCLFCLTIGVTGARAQEQENKLVDRLLKPDMTLSNPAQNKQFNGTGTTPLDKKFEAKSFYSGNETRTKSFSSGQGVSVKDFQAAKFTRAEKVARASGEPAFAKVKFATGASALVRTASDEGKAAATRDYAESRPFLGEGTRQKILSQQDKPLTIDEIRELLNKSK
ncbi:MAG: hypothetical protein ABIR29_04675 [Chthoniobacterales bacterium]